MHQRKFKLANLETAYNVDAMSPTEPHVQRILALTTNCFQYVGPEVWEQEAEYSITVQMDLYRFVVLFLV